jgi:hypothetical protein
MDNPTDKKRCVGVKVIAKILDEATETTEEVVLLDRATREGLDKVTFNQSIEFVHNEDGSIKTDERNCAVRSSSTFTLTATFQEK